jgi:pyruvate kinase
VTAPPFQPEDDPAPREAHLTPRVGRPRPKFLQTGPQRLLDHTRFLLGPVPRGRCVRIMVTMPSEAATDPKLVQGLLGAGMDVMGINCAHDEPAEWSAMVENLRQA